ncbi:hypothetical protein [Chryseobacterium daecheongense]|uniref:Lipoprotein n=1 Tax=Chryseobacterium daecheongense TaxID=192389 RepID=A0A3N0W3N9_9FLAO|nr:hypothetical protein [Chryseobacterium daecheongense]ROH99675.1 hypothetical protein EGI05_01930 [Chryseobacterium daecheongense]TDX95410.1 hypothetical protein BCF50_1188 [Chryseobacterium daecheongense]
MRTLFLIICFLTFFSCKKENNQNTGKNSTSSDSSVISQTKVDSVKNESSPVEEIKKEYEKFQDLLITKKLDSVKFEYDCNGERSGKVVFYSDKEGLRIIQHSYAEYSHFSSVENYYVKNNKPFFIFKEDVSWNFDGGTPEKPITKDDITEQRIYLQNNKAIKCLEKNYSIRSGDSHNPNPQKTANKEVNCSDEELLKTYQLLMKNKEKRRKIQCL